MMMQKVYIDTSVLGGYFDKEFDVVIRRFFNEDNLMLATRSAMGDKFAAPSGNAIQEYRPIHQAQ
jgi:hypothetical protein